MMIKVRFIRSFAFISCAGFSSLSNGQTTKNIPDQPEAPTIKIESTYGEKKVDFLVFRTKAGARVDFSSSGTPIKTKNISTSNFDYLNNRIKKIPGTPNDRSFCTRNNISISYQGRTVLGCLGASNPFAKETLKITNLVAALF